MRTTLAALLLTVWWPQPTDAQHLHPKFKSKEVQVVRLAVLPVRVEVTRSGVKGGESMIRESEAVSVGVQAIVSRLLNGYGFTVVEDPVAPNAGAASSDEALDERRASMASLQSRFDALAPQLMAKPKDVTKGRFSLGDEVSGLVSDKVEALVFVRGKAVVHTKGKRFLQGGLLGMAVGPKGQLLCDVVIADARSGDVLFFSRIAGQGDIVKSAGGQVEKPLSKSLKKVALRS